MSQLMTALTATAVRAGDPNASTPSTMSATPHKIDHVEACRTISDGLCCVIEVSSMDEQSVLLKGVFAPTRNSFQLARQSAGITNPMVTHGSHCSPTINRSRR